MSKLVEAASEFLSRDTSTKQKRRVIKEYFKKVHIGSSESYHVHSVDPENAEYTLTHKKTGKKHTINVEDNYPNNTHSKVHADVKHYLKSLAPEAMPESSEIAKHINKHISDGQKEFKKEQQGK